MSVKTAEIEKKWKELVKFCKTIKWNNFLKKLKVFAMIKELIDLIGDETNITIKL